MKRPYTQFHSKLARDAKAIGLMPEEYFNRLNWKLMMRKLEAEIGHDRAVQKILKNYMVSKYDLRLINGNSLHVFIPGDRAFCDWLASCAKDILSLDIFNAIEELVEGKIVVLHFPTSSGLSSVSFGFEELTNTDRGGERLIITGDLIKLLLLLPSREKYWFYTFAYNVNKEVNLNDVKQHFKADAGIAEDGDYYLRLVFGLLLYCDAFPETIKQGLPEDLNHPSHHKYDEAQTVGITPKITTGVSHSSPCAHYRIGHFRVLKSDFFTKKRFKSVFVHGTFVKGTAKTIDAV